MTALRKDLETDVRPLALVAPMTALHRSAGIHRVVPGHLSTPLGVVISVAVAGAMVVPIFVTAIATGTATFEILAMAPHFAETWTVTGLDVVMIATGTLMPETTE